MPVEVAIEAHLDRVFSGEPVDEVMRVRFVSKDVTHPAWGFSIMTSVLTLSTINLIGIPVNRCSMEVDLLVAIGEQEEPTYRVSGTGSAYQAYWYGYSAKDAGRLASLRATRAALRELDRVLGREREKIRQRLQRPATSGCESPGGGCGEGEPFVPQRSD